LGFCTLPIEDIITGAEKAVHSLPVEMAEKIRQETVRIIKSSKRPKDNLTRAERRAVKSVCANGDLTILPADKGNAAVIDTLDYKQKLVALLEDPAYRKLTKDPTVKNFINLHTMQNPKTRTPVFISR
jgi:hypothetical protein